MNCYQCGKAVESCACVGGAYLLESKESISPPPPMLDARATTWTAQRTTMHTPQEHRMSQEKYDEHIEKLREAMAGAPDALRFFSKHHPAGQASTRMPLGIISEGLIHSETTSIIVVSPDVTFRPTHLVVSHETSKAFNLVQMTVANVGASAGGYDIPLESFSMEYLASLEGEELKAIMSLQKWGIDTVTPAMRISIYVKNISDQARAFRGIIWGEASLIW